VVSTLSLKNLDRPLIDFTNKSHRFHQHSIYRIALCKSSYCSIFIRNLILFNVFCISKPIPTNPPITATSINRYSDVPKWCSSVATLVNKEPDIRSASCLSVN
jgi:hypothetical protein